MTTPLIVCAADLTHTPEARKILDELGPVRYIKANPRDVREQLPNADGYFASLNVQVTKELLMAASRLRVIATPSTGLDHLDLKTAAERGIAVLALKDDRELLDQITATAELTWCLILACARRLPGALEAARQGRWARDQFRGHQLAYKTLGILGCGRLGTMVAAYGRAFRMKILGCDTGPMDLPDVQSVGIDVLLREADVLSVHIHLSPENRGLINREALAKMKPGAILINTSRGAIVDEIALLEALEKGRLSAAGLDVIDGEWREDLDQHPLIRYARTHDNLIITPHIGGVTYESQAIAFAATARKLVDYLRGISATENKS